MSSTIFSVAWLKGMAERAIKSFVQGGIAGLGLSAATPGKLPGLLDVPWSAGLSAGVLMAVLSIATSVLQPDFTAGAPADPPAALDDDGEDATAFDGEPDEEGEDLLVEDEYEDPTPEHAADAEPVDGDDDEAYVEQQPAN